MEKPEKALREQRAVGVWMTSTKSESGYNATSHGVLGFSVPVSLTFMA